MHYSHFLNKKTRWALVVLVIHLYACCNPTALPPEGISPAYKSNVIVAFFEEAELQIETQDQCRELARALQDMLTLTPEELKKQRYANYQLEPDKWSLKDILARYYYARPGPQFDKFLYRDTRTAAAKAKIKLALADVQNC